MRVTGALASPRAGRPEMSKVEFTSDGAPNRPPVAARRNSLISSRLFCISVCCALSASISLRMASASFGLWAEDWLQARNMKRNGATIRPRRRVIMESSITFVGRGLASPRPPSEKDLPRIQDPVRIEHRLHPPHQGNLVGRQLDRQERRLRE